MHTWQTLQCILTFGGQERERLIGNQAHSTPQRCSGGPCAAIIMIARRIDGTGCTIFAGWMVFEQCNALFHVLANPG